MRGAPVVPMLILVALLAGCIGTDPDVQVDDTAPLLKDDGKIQVRAIKVDPAWTPTLETPPQWRLGKWWLYRMSDFFTGQERTFYRVVAGQENATGSYLVGMPTHGFSNEVMTVHTPGFGQIDRETLGYEAHDCVFDPLRFPIEDGGTRKTKFQCGGVIVSGDIVSDTVAEFTVIPDPDAAYGFAGSYTYDAKVGEITRLSIDDFAEYEIIAHGHDFHLVPGWEGNVTVPYGHDLIFRHGRVSNVFAIRPDSDELHPATDGPTDTVIVPDAYDRVSFALILADISGSRTGGAIDGIGRYTELAVAPDGTEYYNEHLGSGIRHHAYKNDAPVGTWTFEHMTLGYGLAMAEGIGYSVFDIRLPYGDRLDDGDEHEHAGGQGH